MQNSWSCWSFDLAMVAPILFENWFCLRIYIFVCKSHLNVESSYIRNSQARYNFDCKTRWNGKSKVARKNCFDITKFHHSHCLIIIINHGCTPYLILNAVSDLYEERSNMCWPHFIDCWWNIYENENWLLALCLHNRH